MALPTRIEKTLAALSGKSGFFITIAAGAISVLGHAPFYIWPAFIIAMALFMVRLNAIAERAEPNPEKSRKKTMARAAFWAGWAFGFGYFLASLYWIASAFITRGGGYVLLTPLGVTALPAGLAFFWAVAAMAYVKLIDSRLFSKRRILHGLIFALIFFAAEWLRGNILSGFPWNLPGYIWQAGGAMSQSAFLFGVYGLSFFTLLLAATLATALSSKPKNNKDTFLKFSPLIISAFIMIGLFGYGSSRLSNAVVEFVEGTNIRVVGAKIDQQEKYGADTYSQTIDTYLELSTRPSDAPLTHVVWPEGAIAGLPLEDVRLMSALNNIFTGGPTLLMGVTRRAPNPQNPDEYQYFNSLAALRPAPNYEMETLALYNKSKLVPFGEYFPFNQWVEGFEVPALTAATSSFDRGNRGLTVLPNLPLASVQICYESIFTGFTPRDTSADPDNPPRNPKWILNVSNDSWFGASTGPHQHFNQTRYRAIEEGLPLVRATSSGFSGFVDPYGRIIKSSDGRVSAVLDSPLPKALTRR